MYNFYLKRPLPEDFKFIYSVISNNLKEKCPPKDRLQYYFEEILNNDKETIFTVNNGNRTAGFAHITEVFSLINGHYAEIPDFQISEFFRKNGADVYLLKALEQWASQMLCCEIRFLAYEKADINLLERLNYTKDENSRYYIKRL